MTTRSVDEIHRDALVFLGHNDIPYKLTPTGIHVGNVGEWMEDAQLDFPKLAKGGVDASFLHIGVAEVTIAPSTIEHRIHGGKPAPYRRSEPVFWGPDAVKWGMWKLRAYWQALEANADRVELARGAGDVERISGKGKIAVVMQLGGALLGSDINMVDVYHRLGVHVIELCHSGHDWCDSEQDGDHVGGLSDFGKEMVREMNRVGILVDMSHSSDKAFYKAVETSGKPVVASHSACRALTDSRRNITDDMLRALRDSGGVIGIHFASWMTYDEAYIRAHASNPRGDERAQYHMAMRAKHKDPFELARALAKGPEYEYIASGMSYRLPERSPISRLAEHIDRAVEVAGIDHVGIGPDLNGIDDPPKDLEDVSKLPNLTAELLRRGYGEDDLRKILGGNFLRVFREVAGG